MKILPPTTQPPLQAIERRHRPKKSRRWSDYRACLRWDFAFTCGFCLLHEVDLFGSEGGEGLGGTSAEHVELRSVVPERADDYNNLIYACRFCNTARSDRPNRYGDRALLDPTAVAWGQRFRAQKDRLEPQPNDRDAAYTAEVYDLNEPRKVRRRRLRRSLLEDRLELLAEMGTEIEALSRLASARLEARDLQAFEMILKEIQSLRVQARRALGDLLLFPAIPADRPTSCRCPADRQQHEAPAWFAAQTLSLRL